MATDPRSRSRAAPWYQAFVLAAGLALVWTAATYLLEGRRLTLLRPEATVDRLTYAVVANLLVGGLGSVAVLRWAARQGLIDRAAAGFRGGRHALVSGGLGLALGAGIYALQPAPIGHPVVLLNGFAQVLVVSIAEVLVCWAVVGALAHRALQPCGARLAFTGAALLASGLFGAYHIAHSPPFNTGALMLLLTAVGLGTSTFFFVTRDVYGTIAFHTMLGLYGVTQSLAGGGRLAPFEALQPPLLLLAGAAAVLLVLADAYALRRR